MKKYYTSGGDRGETDQLGKSRISKAHIRIQTLGALDECSAALGVARAQSGRVEINQLVKEIQSDLYQIMTLVALEKPNPEKFPDLDKSRLSWLEDHTDHFGSQADPVNEFILPGENLPSAAFGLARTVTRRAERNLVELNDRGLLFSENSLPYVNRLSSLCFVIEVFLAQNPLTGEDFSS
jgi:cob(I)alamin adenosyltransferase